MKTLAAVTLCLFAFAVSAEDGGAAAPPAHAAVRAADAGKASTRALDAGAADAGSEGWKARATFVLAKDPATLDKWGKTPPQGRAALPTQKTAKVGERLYIGLFLENWELPPSRRVDLVADVMVVDCNGRAVLEKAMAAGARTLDPKLNLAVPLMPWVELMFGLTDPECAYKVSVTIWDHVRGQSAHTEGTFTLAR